jgi:D-proline reductase (dithiol) PrdB
MGDLSEFPLKYKLFLKVYPWRRIDPVPWTALKKPLKDSRLALVSSAGFIKPGQEPFDESIRGGDYSFREIPSDTDVSGRIGSLNQRHLSFMGSITAPGRLVKKTAPVAVRKLVEDGVDIALLMPV